MKQRPARTGFKYAVTFAVILLALLVWHCQAQFRGRGRGGWRMQAQDSEQERENELMQKAINPAFKSDVFTFARLKFDFNDGYAFGGRRAWDDDSPAADLNVIFRLYETTSLKVRPGLNFIDITTNELPNFPFVYVAAGGRFTVTDPEAEIVRNYLNSGGFIMVDDFWGDEQWHHCREQIKRIFPKREPVEIGMDHPIFHNIYPFKKAPQIPSVGAYMQFGTSYDPGWPFDEKNHDAHYYAIYDDKNRMMMLLCHNNHYGDGWEHEGDEMTYFDKFSQAQAYPMLFNILVYVMSH